MSSHIWKRLKYQRLRAEMIEELGGACAHCGSTECLEFNHIVERYWVPRKVSSISRLKNYQEEIGKGHINLLCKSCNCRYTPLPNMEVPF